MTDQTRAQRLQWLIAAVFFILGGWCLVAPASMMELTVREAYRIDHPLVLVSLRAFGAQAVLAGIFAALSRFTRWTFLGFGVAVLPFFGFEKKAAEDLPLRGLRVRARDTCEAPTIAHRGIG